MSLWRTNNRDTGHFLVFAKVVITFQRSPLRHRLSVPPSSTKPATLWFRNWWRRLKDMCFSQSHHFTRHHLQQDSRWTHCLNICPSGHHQVVVVGGGAEGGDDALLTDMLVFFLSVWNKVVEVRRGEGGACVSLSLCAVTLLHTAAPPTCLKVL